MAPKRTSNRYCLLCPVCHKTQGTLSVHLRRVCMRKATNAAVKEIMKKARQDMRELLTSHRVFKYENVRLILNSADPLTSLIQELERRKLVVTGVPEAPQPAPQKAATVSHTTTDRAIGPDSVEVTSDDVDDNSGEYFQTNLNRQRPRKNRVLMEEMGMYKRHSTDHSLLKDFATYLRSQLGVDNYKHEVQNVARFLYFADPATPSLLFVHDRKKLGDYLKKLTEAKLSKQTQFNYLKNLKRFLLYHTVNTDLILEDPTLHQHAKHYIDVISSMQKSCSRQVGKEIVRKRDEMVRKDLPVTPQMCLKVLEVSKPDFLAINVKIIGGWGRNDVQLSIFECTLVLQYLNALIQLKHLQRPGVVEGMTIEEWKHRRSLEDGYTLVSVKKHKTGAREVASFVLSPEEDAWFTNYFDVVRDQLKNMKRVRTDMDRSLVEKDDDPFFISSTNKPIHRASNDLHRLHTKYNLAPVTSQTARRVFETATKNMSDVEKSLVADYLTHSTVTAEKHYRVKQASSLMKAHALIKKLGGDPSSDSGDEVPTTSSTYANQC